MKKHFIFLVTILLFGCASHKTNQKKPDPVATYVTVNHVTADTWEIELKFSKPISQYVFTRQQSQFRRDQFKSLSSGAKVDLVQRKELLDFVIPTNSVKFQITTFSDPVAKDYEMFRLFSDGGVALYTGHFEGIPFEKDDQGVAKELARSETYYRFIPLKTEKVIQNSVAAELGNSAGWEDKKSKGTYAYFGNAELKTTAELSAIVEPKIPNWISDKIQKELSRYLQNLNQRLGTQLSSKLFVLVTGQDFKTNALIGDGSSLPGMIELNLIGSEWKVQRKKAEVKLAKFFVNQLSRFFLEHQYSDKDSTMWLSEGASDAFAFKLMKEGNVIGNRRYLEILSYAFNNCMYHLEGKPILRNPGNDNEFRPSYYCGALIHLVADAKVKKTNPKLDLFSVWQNIFQIANNNLGNYGEKDFETAVNNLTDKQFGTQLLDFVNTKSAGMVEPFVEQLKSVGFKLEVATESEETIKKDWGKRVLYNLVSNDCGAGILRLQPDHYQVETLASCQRLKKNLNVSMVEEVDILNDGETAYDKVQQVCTDLKRKIKVGDETDSVFLNCVSLAKRPLQYKFTVAP